MSYKEESQTNPKQYVCHTPFICSRESVSWEVKKGEVIEEFTLGEELEEEDEIHGVINGGDTFILFTFEEFDKYCTLKKK